MNNVRTQAALVLNSLIKEQVSLAESLPKQQKNIENQQDRALLQELCYGVCRHFQRLDFFAKQLLHKPLKKKNSLVHALILLGLYQLEYSRIPAHAAVHETVHAAKVLKQFFAFKLINQVLRNFQRQRDDLLAKLTSNNANVSAAYYAHPDWLLKQLQLAWPNDWQAIANANNQAPPFSLRINLSKTDRTSYIKKLKESLGALDDGEIIHPLNSWFAESLILKKAIPCSDLPDFENGHLSVQDLAAQASAHLLKLRENLRLLDACAAPGGKTCHLLEKENTLNLTALDISQTRLNKIQENLTRLKLKANLICADANELDTWWDGKQYGRILLDAPCSATGVIRRHPDIKLLRTQEDITNINNTQKNLLTTLWQCLKPGGYLLYATCSVLPAENDEVINWFKQTEKTCKLITIENLPAGFATANGWQFLPTQNGPDGFYYALLQKQ